MKKQERGYSAETLLVSAFEEFVGAFSRAVLGSERSKRFVIKEFDSQMGIADIVIGTYQLPSLRQRHSRNSINENWVFPLTRLEVERAGQLLIDSVCAERH